MGHYASEMDFSLPTAEQASKSYHEMIKKYEDLEKELGIKLDPKDPAIVNQYKIRAARNKKLENLSGDGI